jgi:hypothetical protein
MIDASLPVQRAIRDRLIADATVNGLVVGQIFDGVPLKAVKPYLSFGPSDMLPDVADCLEGGEITLQIDGWAQGPDTVQAKRLGAAVSRSLHWAEMPLDEEQRLLVMQVEQVQYLRDPDGITAHAVITVRALTEPIVIFAPFVQLSGSTVPENAVIGAAVGTLSTLGTFTGTPAYTLVDNASGHFALAGAVIQVAAGLDFETAPSYSIIVGVAGITPAVANQTFTITVTDIDEIPPTITSVNSVNNVENTVLALALTASEPVTWSIVGGVDSTRFEISGSTLRWPSNGTRDFEAPADSNSDNVYIVQVRATDLAGNQSTPQTITVTVSNIDDTAPTITSPATDSIAENTVLAHALTASETVTWSIVGGPDAAQFELSGSTLRWLGNGTKDFEAPTDSNLDNAYVVQVRATDTVSLITTQTITVTVTNVVEGTGTNGTPIGLLLALTQTSGGAGTGTAGSPTGLLLGLTKAT